MEGTQFVQPPPNLPPSLHIPPPNLATPPPNLNLPPPNISGHGAPLGPPNMNKYENRQNFNPRSFFRPFQSFGPRGPMGPMTLEDFDGKRLRKSVMRKTVDYNSAIIKALENRVWQRDFRDRRALQPDVMYYPDLMPPPSYPDNAMNCVTTRFVKTATNKMRCPIFCMAWTPEGRRLVTGASSGEFTLWNGLTFNFETILQAHDSPVRTMVWSHNDSWMVTGDHAGYVKYWQSNMNNVKMFQAHKEALRGISFSPMDSKFVTCSDDGTLRIWDFLRCHEERILRGHGADVKCVHWHPQKGLIISGSKDNQQPIKLWDPKTGNSLATLHAHKSTVMDLKWNENGNWLITASRDHLLKLFDLRNLSQEVQTFRGHKKEASSVAWHPVHEGLFSSGGSDGSIMFWHVGADKEVGAIEQAHDSIVWTLAWHPLGHILCSGSNDHTSKFWTRNRPGDLMRDKYNLNTLPAGLAGLEDADIDEPSVIPGMGPEDKVELSPNFESSASIPGLDLDITAAAGEDKQSKLKKVPYSKPIPRNFQAQWNETSGVDDAEDESGNDAINEVISHIVENTPGVVPLQKIEPSAIIVYGKLLPVEPGSKLEKVIAEGPDALKKYIASGAIEELHDVMPHDEDNDYLNDSYEDNDDLPSSSSMAAVDVQLPPPLPSSKLAQVVAQKNQLSLASQLQNLQNQGLTMNLDNKGNNSDKQRRSRFADMADQQEQDHYMDQDMRPMYAPFTAGCNQQRNADIDLRGGPGGGGPGGGKVDIRALKQLSQDIDMRQHDDDDMNNDMDDQDMDYRGSGGGGGGGYYEGHSGGFRDQQQGFGNNSNKFSNNSDPRTQQNQQQWQQNNGSGGQTFSGAGDNNFGARGPNFMVNQNGPPYGPPFPNYRPPPHGPPPGFQPNYRPDGPWNGMPRPDSFRGRGGFGPGGPRMPMRGGPRPPRGFPGRGGWMPPPRTNGPTRGRF